MLFQFLISNARFERSIERTQAALFERQRLQERLESLFFSLYPPEISADAPFYTALFPNEKTTSLIALFNAGIDPNPSFSGPNTARLFLNEKKEFCFAQWPLIKEGCRTEILVRDVRAMEWEFLGNSLDKDIPATRIGNGWAWMKQWPKSLVRGIPSIIRLKIWRGIDKKKQTEPNVQLAFVLPNQEPAAIVKN